MTERNYNPNQKENAAMKKSAVAEKPTVKNTAKTETKKEVKETTPKVEEKKIITKPKDKKNEAIVNSYSVHASTKYSVALCKFLKKKTIPQAIEDLKMVIAKRKAVPMTGEIPHRKGKGMMSGRYPVRAAELFIPILKTLQGNANVNELDNPVIVEAVPNMAARPYGRFGKWQRKRTHIKIVAREIKK